MTDQNATEDRFKGTGQFHPDKSWANTVKVDSRRRAASRLTWKDSAYAGWMVGLIVLCAAGALVAFGFWLFG